MLHLRKTLPIAALLVITLPVGAWAQESASDDETSAPATESGADQETGQTDAPAEGGSGLSAQSLSMGEEVDTGAQVGQNYTAAEFGAWEQRCIRTQESSDPCQLYQLLLDENDNPVAEISIFPLPEGQQAAAGATIITPLMTLLPPGLTLSVDGGSAQRFPFNFCDQPGCVARIGLTADDLQSFRRGAEVTMTIVPAAAPDQTIDLAISLSGFTAGLEAVAPASAEEELVIPSPLDN